jgi:hypothetical protein
MPFGMINSGATFVRMMDKVLEGFDEFADSFIDDIGIFSDTWEFHVEHPRAVFHMNFLLKPIRPKNDRICFFVTGTGNCRMAETLS